MIHCGNFDNDKPVMPFVEEIIPEKPNQSVYDRNDTLENKIQRLKDNGFNYTLETLTEILKKKASMEAKPFVASSGSSNNSVLEEVGTFFNVSFSTMSMNDIERYFETQTEELQKNVKSRIQTMGVQPKKLSTNMNYFQHSQRSSQYGSYHGLLQQFIYALLFTIPEFILSHKTPTNCILPPPNSLTSNAPGSLNCLPTADATSRSGDIIKSIGILSSVKTLLWRSDRKYAFERILAILVGVLKTLCAIWQATIFTSSDSVTAIISSACSSPALSRTSG